MAPNGRERSMRWNVLPSGWSRAPGACGGLPHHISVRSTEAGPELGGTMFESHYANRQIYNTRLA
jgi:hypothetical protein